jgi:isocitrate dehydrogenase kinase/phosphatase
MKPQSITSMKAKAPIELALTILNGFQRYVVGFHEITIEAPRRFLERKWQEVQEANLSRLRVYQQKVEQCVQEATDSLQTANWKEVKEHYQWLTNMRVDQNLAKTFYNSVYRKLHTGTGADMNMMFVIDSEEENRYRSTQPIFETYQFYNFSQELAEELLRDARQAHGFPFENLQRDAKYLVKAFYEHPDLQDAPDLALRLELLREAFYRNKAAYLVGRVLIGLQVIPFVVPILWGEQGVYADNLLLDPNEVSILFSFTRSYFFVKKGLPSETVRFIHSLIPKKKIGEIYNSLGLNKHAKTEFYRDFLKHLEKTDDPFVIAPGVRGMVMSVFTLQSYPIVFKLINDRFNPVKQISRAGVKAKYKLVSEHDRVGRMADTHEFEHFRFPLHRFAPELLEELQEKAPSLLRIEGDDLIISHLYTERRMIPLNIYLQKCDPSDWKEVINEYGKAIKQLAAANIFPGDMLLKNFGVTRHKRVVFYDYDEIGFLTDYRFRELPEADDEEDEMRPGAWFSVDPNDVFPEEFARFLVGKREIRDIFFELHKDLFTPTFWREMQARQRAGDQPEVFPYRRRRRFGERY